MDTELNSLKYQGFFFSS